MSRRNEKLERLRAFNDYFTVRAHHIELGAEERARIFEEAARVIERRALNAIPGSGELADEVVYALVEVPRWLRQRAWLMREEAKVAPRRARLARIYNLFGFGPKPKGTP